MIHGPEYLKNDRPEKVFIMGAGFLDEIFKKINIH
tara:strand:- start:272 stop:376 length:105 start_codon:yes stop_codon:yes gene_type:complete